MNKIGFCTVDDVLKEVLEFEESPEDMELPAAEDASAEITPRKSLVSVFFPDRNTTLTYYNDRFDLCVGDLVFVEGKLEGLRGVVKSLCYSFRIKLSDYKRVISRADTEVRGCFLPLDSHLVRFDRELKYEKVLGWFKAPADEDEEYVSGDDMGEAICLSRLDSLGAAPEIMERGFDYFMRDRVVFVSVEDGRGRAIVDGTRAYELEFTLRRDVDGEWLIHSFGCDCPCYFPCKHQAALLIQLRDSLTMIELLYQDEFERSGGFSLISREVFTGFVLKKLKTGRIVIE